MRRRIVFDPLFQEMMLNLMMGQIDAHLAPIGTVGTIGDQWEQLPPSSPPRERKKKYPESASTFDKNTGITNLMIAISKNELEKSQEYLEGLSDPDNINLQDKNGNTALHYAVNQKRKEAVTQLIFHGADVDLKNKFGFTPIDYAFLLEDREIIKLLVENGGNLRYSPLHITTSQKEILDMIKSIPEIDITGTCGNTEDPITFEPLYPKGSISIKWPEQSKSYCYNLLQLKEQIRKQKSVYGVVRKDGNELNPDVVLITPMYYVLEKSALDLIKSDHRTYRADVVHDKILINQIEQKAYRLVPV